LAGRLALARKARRRQYRRRRGEAGVMKQGLIASVTLAEVPMAERSAIANLMQLYLHDFSEFAAIGTDHGEVGPDGQFPCPWLDAYWREEARIPLAVRADGRLAGFALVNRWSALDRPLDRSVAEFFILRKYRRLQVGFRAAGLLFARFPGRWEAPVAGYNLPALAFWRKAALATADGPVEECIGDGERWTGTVLCFDTRARP
jgi:predicted acetyltransferase